MRKLGLFLILLSCASWVWANAAQDQFLSKIRSFESKKESVAYAKKQLEDPHSVYRNYAVEFFRELREPSYVPYLMNYIDDRDIQTFVLFALGDLQAYEATELLIEKLNNPNENVRGNAHQALMRIYPLNLPQGYRFGQSRKDRSKHVAIIEQWWNENKVELIQNYKRDLAQKSQAQQEAWKKYGKNYLLGQ